MKSVVFAFPGQGSQYYHMGRDLYKNNPIFSKWMNKLEDIAREINGRSVINELYNNKKRIGDIFDRLLYTSPAIFMVEYAMAQVLLKNGIEPDYVLGASMGELASAAIAGVVSAEKALEAIITQASVIESSCQRGGMIAIIDDISLFENTPLINENSELAAINFSSHFIISGRTESLHDIIEFLEAKAILYQVLPVTYAFHSSLIDNAAERCRYYMSGKSYNNPNIPMVSCLYGTILQQLPQDYLWEVFRNPIMFSEAIRTLEKERSNGLIYIDLGPGGTLANFAKRNLDTSSHSEIYPIMTPFNQDLKNLDKIMGKLRKISC